MVVVLQYVGRGKGYAIYAMGRRWPKMVEAAGSREKMMEVLGVIFKVCPSVKVRDPGPTESSNDLPSIAMTAIMLMAER